MNARISSPAPASGRQSGILLHITSLPGHEGIGTLHDGIGFIDALAEAGQTIWQLLPINPTSVGDSPFQGPSVFAGNPNLIDLKQLVEAGDLEESHYNDYLNDWHGYRSGDPGRSEHYAEYGFLWERKLGFDSRIQGFKQTPLRRAWAGFQGRGDERRLDLFRTFCRANQDWLDDYALFMALKTRHGFETPWNAWPDHQRFRLPGFERDADPDDVEFHRYIQFVFDEQMTGLSRKARERGVRLIGDVPIYPAYDSADVWAGPDLFQLHPDGSLQWMAAVPPDYFSATGQLWGNPLYKWGIAGSREDHERVFDWWARRARRMLRYHDLLRIDHFRGFVAYGRVEADAPDASAARWVRGPGQDLLDFMMKDQGKRPPFIAEDLGIITPAVTRLRRRYGLPGMKILLFAVPDDPKNGYLPHNAVREPNSVFYTGTHDNETLRQKLFEILNEEERRPFLEYLSHSSESQTHWQAIDLLSASASAMVVFPMQDVLGLGGEARMNNPSRGTGWWRWRLSGEQFDYFREHAGRHLLGLTLRNGRAPRAR